MGTGYSAYRALFFDALGRLARRGLAVQPADAEDLIHDFFVNVWEGLEERYKPASGSAANYIYGAFVRYARQRIRRLRRWLPRLRDLAFLAERLAGGTEPSPLETLVRVEEAEACRRGLAELSPERRTILLDYFALGPRSRRHLARKYHLTRYRVEELLINALGQLVVYLDEAGVWPLPDREVALDLWWEGNDPEETADRLGQSVEQVLLARERLRILFAGLLRSSHGGNPPAPTSAPASELPR
jgi:RNA polymerase sigma factor (sigma-70 family)